MQPGCVLAESAALFNGDAWVLKLYSIAAIAKLRSKELMMRARSLRSIGLGI